MSYFISVKEASDYLGIDALVVRAMLNRGWLAGEKIDRVWRIPAETVEFFYASVGPRAEWESDPRGEVVLAHNKRCPVCAGSFQPSPRGGTGFADEFLECLDCQLSLHESLLQQESALSEHVETHGKDLQRKENEGMQARSLLLRRKSALRKLEKLIAEAEQPQV